MSEDERGNMDPDSGRVIAVLGEKIDNLSKQVHDLVKLYQLDHTQIIVNTQRLNTLEVLASKPPFHCPDHNRLVDDVVNLRLEMARAAGVGGIAGGGVVAVVSGVLLVVGKVFGWL